MRRVRIVTVDRDIKVLEIDKMSTNLSFVTAEIRAAIDDLASMPAYAQNTRAEILAEFIGRTVETTSSSLTFPLSNEEKRKAVELILKEFRRW